jgi:hypothetical protein
MNALDRDRSRRTPTAAAFAEQLEQVIQHAGGDTLEAWAERHLATARDAHRTWLAGIATGSELPKLIGRATGQVTELAPIGQAKTPAAPAPHVAAPPIIPGVAEEAERTPTSIGGTAMDGLSIPPRGKLAPIVMLLFLLLAIGGGAYLLMRKPTVAVVAHDAAIDGVVTVPAPDAAPADADAPIDAAIDAGMRVVTIRPDAGRPSRDAAIVIAKPDAATAPPATGSGFVIIKYKPGRYANITVDDNAIPGPVLRPRAIAAGRHTIKFIEPQSGEVLDTQTITVEDAKTVEIRQHE